MFLNCRFPFTVAIFCWLANTCSGLSRVFQPHSALAVPKVIVTRRVARPLDAVTATSSARNDWHATAAQEPAAGTLTSSFNLAKSIVGMGVLALPSGLAHVSDDRSVAMPAAALCALYGSLAAYSFSIIGQVCHTYGVASYTDAYRVTISNSTARLVPALTTATCFLNMLACSILIGDSFCELFRSMGAPTALSNRNAALAAVAALAVAPLTQLGSLNALAPLSAVGLAGILFTALMMGVRYIDGSYRYSNLGGEIGRFLAELPTPSRPSFNVFRRNTGDWHSILSPSVFILLSMFNTAFVAHYHAPRIYMELREKTMEKFNLITSLSFGLSTAVFIFMMTVGFLTFGGNCHGFILSNYANSDVFASASRLAVGLTLLSGYPILFTALRDNLVDIFGLQGWAKSRPGALKAGSIALLFATTLLATRFRDVSFLVSFTGALCGSLLMFVFPALMSIKVESTRYDSVRNDLLDVEYSVPYWEKSAYNSDKLSQMDKLNQSLFRIRFRKIASYIMLFIGCVMAVAGVLVSTLRAAGVELGTS